MGLIDVYAAIIPNFLFRPTLHVQYGEGVLHVRDALPKFESGLDDAKAGGLLRPPGIAR